MNHIMRKRIFYGVLGLGGAVLLLLNLLTPMLCDDYRYAFSFATGERLSSLWQIFPSLAAHGRVLNGRYAPHFFVQLFSLLPEICFDVVNTAAFLLLALGLYRLAFRQGREPLLLAGILGALVLLPPVFGQNMLWMAGACNYLWPAAALVWLLHPFVGLLLGREVRLRPVAVAAMAVGGLLFGNASENLSAAGLMLMGLCILYRSVRREATPLWMWLTAGLVAAGWLLLMLAPVAKPVEAPEAGLLGVLLERFSHCVEMWLTHLGGITAVWAVLVCLAAGGVQKQRLVPSLLLALCALCCQLAMVASSYFPERVLLGPIVLMLCACLVLLPEPGSLYAPLCRGLYLCLCVLALLTTAMALPHTYNRGQLARARDAEMMAAAAAGQRQVTTFGVLGRTRLDAYQGLLEMSSDPEHFANVAYAAYYGLESVTVERVE